MKKILLLGLLLGSALIKADITQDVVSYLESAVSVCDEALVEAQASYTEALESYIEVLSQLDELALCESTVESTETLLESAQEVLASIPALGPIKKIASGEAHSLMLLENGSLWATGYNQYGQLGTGDTLNRSAFIPVVIPSEPEAVFIDIAAGIDHSLALKNDGTVWATGYNFYGQLGIGSTDQQLTLTIMTDNNNSIIALAAGGNHSLVLKNDGTIWATGKNQFGQLGIGTCGQEDMRLTLTQMTENNNSIIALAAGGNHSLALKSDGTIWATGGNQFGQLGIGTGEQEDMRLTLTQMTENNNSIIALAAGYLYSLVLKNDGTVWATGENNSGQLGIGSTDQQLTLTPMTDFNSSVTSIAAGIYHSLVLKNDGTVWATGGNDSGQLGIGSTDRQLTLTPMTENNNSIIALAAGGGHSLVLKNDGTVWGTGYNGRGQLALGYESFNPDTTLARSVRLISYPNPMPSLYSSPEVQQEPIVDPETGGGKGDEPQESIIDPEEGGGEGEVVNPPAEEGGTEADGDQPTEPKP